MILPSASTLIEIWGGQNAKLKVLGGHGPLAPLVPLPMVVRIQWGIWIRYIINYNSYISKSKMCVCYRAKVMKHFYTQLPWKIHKVFFVNIEERLAYLLYCFLLVFLTVVGICLLFFCCFQTCFTFKFFICNHLYFTRQPICLSIYTKIYMKRLHQMPYRLGHNLSTERHYTFLNIIAIPLNNVMSMLCLSKNYLLWIIKWV